ncbi:MAG: hypothetical protein IJB46_02140 [Prevotella sp.]|nr:hypothetical protein [Prevotella sp.]
MMKTLHFVFFTLLSCCFVPAMADDRRVVFDESFSQGLGAFSQNQTDMREGMGDEEYDSQPQVIVWTFNETYESVQAYNPTKREIMADLRSVEIDLRDKLLQDVVLSFENTVVGANTITNGSMQLLVQGRYEGEEYYTTSSGVFANEITKGQSEGVFTNYEYSLEQYVGMYIKITFTGNMGYNSPRWLIKNLMITGTHPYGNKESVLVDDVESIKQQENGTLITLSSDKLVLMASGVGGSIQYVKDETAAIRLHDNDIPWSMPGEVFGGSVTGIISRTSGVIELTDVTFDGRVSQEEWVSVQPVEIAESELSNNECQLVRFRLTERVVFDDILDCIGGDKDYTPTNNTIAVGFVDRVENGIRHIVPTTVDAYARVVLDESTPFEYSEEEIGIACKVIRNLKAGQWAIVTLPFNYDCRFLNSKHLVALFTSAADGVLQFERTKSIIPAYTPFLIKFNTDLESFSGYLTDDTNLGFSVDGGDYSLCGTLSEVTPGIEGCYYMAENNVLKRLSKTGVLFPYKGYFRPNSASSAKVIRLAVDGIEDDQTTDIDIPLIDENRSDGRIYNLNGQFVGTSFENQPQGIYIINGNKVIK